MFQYDYRTQFFDTDAMGVVHHANYVRIMEMACVAWMRHLGVIELHIPHGPMVLGVTNVEVEFRRPVKFDDALSVFLEGRLNGALLELRYAIWCERLQAYASFGRTELALLKADTLQPTRFPPPWREILRSQPWNSIWPPDPPQSLTMT